MIVGLSPLMLRFRLLFVLLLILWGGFGSPRVAIGEEGFISQATNQCVRLVQRLVTGKKYHVKYWEELYGRKLVEGEVLQTSKLGNNNFVYRFDGQRISWEFYRITGRGYIETSAYYPKKFFSTDYFAGKRVLDVGCGHGRFVESLRKMLEKTGAEPQVEGMDIELNANTRDKDYFHKQDVRETTFKDGEFDTIVSTWSIFSYEQHSNPVFMRQALAEMKRILKPGGRILLAPIDPAVFKAFASEVGGLKVVETGRQRRIQPDQATILTIGKYIVLEKSAG